MAFGITFWQNLVCGSLLLAYSLARGRPLPMSPRHIRFYFIVAILGDICPGQAVSIWPLNMFRAGVLGDHRYIDSHTDLWHGRCFLAVRKNRPSG